MKAQEHYSEATRLAARAERVRRQPGQPFDVEPWLKALVHATLALYSPEPAPKPAPKPAPLTAEDRAEVEEIVAAALPGLAVADKVARRGRVGHQDA